MFALPICIVLCRLAAVFLVLRGLSNATLLVFPTSGAESEMLFRALFSAILLVAAPFAAALVVWFFARRISAVANDVDVQLAPPLELESSLIRAGLFLLGVYFLVTGVELALSVETVIWLDESIRWNSPSIANRELLYGFVRRAPYVARLAIGVFLLLGRDKLLQLAAWARFAGRAAT